MGPGRASHRPGVQPGSAVPSPRRRRAGRRRAAAWCRVRPLMDEWGRIGWVAPALSDADRSAAAEARPVSDGYPVHLVDVPSMSSTGTTTSCPTRCSGSCTTDCSDLTRDPELEGRPLARGLDVVPGGQPALRRDRDRHAPHVCGRAGPGLPPDPARPHRARPRDDLTLVHFHHTPFADPTTPECWVTGAAHRDARRAGRPSRGRLHVSGWAENYSEVQRRWGGHDRPDPARVFHLHPPTATSRTSGGWRPSPLRRRWGSSTDCFDDRQLIVRADRMELSKNIVRVPRLRPPADRRP